MDGQTDGRTRDKYFMSRRQNTTRDVAIKLKQRKRQWQDGKNRYDNKTVVDNRFSPPFVRYSQRVLPVFIVEQNLVGISAIFTLVVFYRRLGIHMTRPVASM